MKWTVTRSVTSVTVEAQEVSIEAGGVLAFWSRTPGPSGQRYLVQAFSHQGWVYVRPTEEK